MRTPIIDRSVPASIVTLLVAIGCTKSPPSTTSSSPRSSAVVVPVAAVSAASTPAEPGVRVELHADGSVTVDGVAVTGDAIRDAFRNKPGDEVAVIQAGSDDDWGRVIHVLDQMKQAGDRPFVLAVTGDRLKTTTMRFPKAGAVAPPPPTPPRPGEHVSEIRPMVAVHIGRDGAIAVDGSPLAGSLRKRLKEAIARQDGEVRVIILADAQARFALVVEASRDAQAEGGLIAFGVQAPPRAAAPPEDRSRPKPRSESFARCPFPAPADKAGVDTAVATLRVKVDATGKVTDVTVVNDPGHGFGAAAKACAAKASFEAARDPSGRAVAGEVVMRIRFER